MLFSSMTFIYLFLPIVCAVYLLSRIEMRNHILMIASIFFYAWGEPKYLVIMLITILNNYISAILIDRYRNKKRYILIFSIFLNLFFLVYFKYSNFIIFNINTIFSINIKFIDVIMPIGISFYTFQAMSYLIDIYRDEVAVQKDFYKLALYITLFPQLVAGPIVKYHDIAGQINERDVTFDKVSYGVKRFIIGLSKKILIANTLGAVADKIFSQPVECFDSSIAWIGAMSYSLQLYYDFSGYSDMAIGLGSIFGFTFLENFNYPYISKSITEFWRRWHISLSTWFKEYLYISLGGNRVNKLQNYFNLFLVFLTTGVWHGASWNFIVWGLWHGLFIVFERVTGWNNSKKKWFLKMVQHIYTVLIFLIGWVMFRADNLGYAWKYIINMTGFLENNINAYEFAYYIDVSEIITFFIAIFCAMPIFNGMINISLYEKKFLRSIVNAWLMFLFLLSTATIAASTYNPFIYFRF